MKIVKRFILQMIIQEMRNQKIRNELEKNISKNKAFNIGKRELAIKTAISMQIHMK